MNLRPAIYTRVSTSEQTTDSQILEVREFCRRRADWDPAIEFTDTISGAEKKRPGLDALMEAVRRRRIDVVVVYRFDRFARSTKHLVDAQEEFSTLGVQFVSLHEQVDTTTANGRFFFRIFAALAELERDLLRDRVRSGMAAAAARGKLPGRPQVSRDGEKADTARRMFAAGRPMAWISRQTGIKPSTVRRIVLELPGAKEGRPKGSEKAVPQAADSKPQRRALQESSKN